MKKTFFLLFAVCALARVNAQTNLQLVTVLTGRHSLPNGSPATGQGAFTLNGDAFHFYVRLPFGSWSARIHGPADCRGDAPVIFDLGQPTCSVPNFGDPGGCAFVGDLTLNRVQLRQLLHGLWYVEVKFYDLGVPTVTLRGQITPELNVPLAATLRGAEEVPPNTSRAIGNGIFQLSSNSFSFIVGVGGISSVAESFGYGPAIPGSIGSPLFSLGTPTFNPIFCDHCQFPTPGYIFSGSVTLTELQILDLLAGKLYVSINTAAYPNGEVRGQIVLADTDADGVPDFLDQCPNTSAGAVVDGCGCSIEQLSPCDAPWKTHAEYVKRVINVVLHFRREGLITASEARAIVKQAATSDCGKHKSLR